MDRTHNPEFTMEIYGLQRLQLDDEIAEDLLEYVLLR
jgi:hypothetical protein